MERQIRAPDGECVKEESRFEAFYESTRKPLYAYLYRVLGEVALAQDLFQESYLRLLKADTSALNESARKAYLFRIAANLMNDHFRKRKREREYENKSMAMPLPIPPDLEQTERVTSALQELSVQNRSLLWLAHVEQFDHAQIAEMLGIKSGSVRVLLFRAKQRILAILGTSGEKKVR
jgi:RNA polymerase sigma-70 factor, ECF subfamily